MRAFLRLTKADHGLLERHLFPGDGKEAVAVALCGRRRSKVRPGLFIQKVVPIPYEQCSIRRPDLVKWSTERLLPLLAYAAERDLAVLKIHSHPTGYPEFSSTDDASDMDLFNSVFGWTDSEYPHASAIMLPGGRMFGRAILPDGSFVPLYSVIVVGDDINFWTLTAAGILPAFTQRHAQMFGAGTTHLLRQLSVAVVGCSGTGGPLIEMLARLGVGRLVLIDPDCIELKNLNRIPNSTLEDAYLKRPKVEVMARAIAAMGFHTEVEMFPLDLASAEAVKAVAGCDVVFGCMDSIEGRHILNRLATFYLLPYFDLGVRLDADGTGGIDNAAGAIHYIRPDSSTLKDRGVYNDAELEADGLRRTDRVTYQERLRAGYIRGVREDRPAVISINTQVASAAVNELLARLHPYRLDGNDEYATVRINFVHGHTAQEREPMASRMFLKYAGHGDVTPLLSMPILSEGPS